MSKTVQNGSVGLSPAADPWSGLPGGRLGRAAVVAAIAVAMAVDGIWLNGAVFGSPAWRLILKALVVGGVAIGVLAYWCQRR